MSDSTSFRPLEFTKIVERARSADILEVIRACGIEVPANLQISCPFHDDDQPSMHIYTEDNRAYCFSCQSSFDPISFVRKFIKKDFHDAVIYLVENFETTGPEDEDILHGPILPPRRYFLRDVPLNRVFDVQDKLIKLEFRVKSGEMHPLTAGELVWHIVQRESGR